MRISISCRKRKLVKLLEEFFCSLPSLFKKHELILHISLPVCIHKCKFTSIPKLSECSPQGEWVIDDLVDEFLSFELIPLVGIHTVFGFLDIFLFGWLRGCHSYSRPRSPCVPSSMPWSPYSQHSVQRVP